MVIRTYFDKNNTIVSQQLVNTARNPIAELFYGGPEGENRYSRFLFHFDEQRLRELYSGGTFTDLTKLKHTLRLTNTGRFDQTLLNKMSSEKDRASSFDLIVFKLPQDWDEGVGYDYTECAVVYGNCSIYYGASNWYYAQTGIYWNTSNGTYSGNPSGITVATQHFDVGNENIEMDVSDYVNNIITGGTNYGLGIAYAYPFELTNTRTLQYVGFFTRHTNTIYEPYIETKYTNYIKDDRNNFFLDKPNKLYLYVNLGGNPTNLDNLPSVTIYDNEGNIYASYTSSDVTHVTKGVYSIDITVNSGGGAEPNLLFNDVWSDIVINGISRPDISLDFQLMDSGGYYNIGGGDTLPKKVGVSISGLRSQERIKRGDIRKVIVSTRIPYTVEQTQMIDSIKYRLYVREGKNEYNIVDFEQLEITSNYNYFLLDTQSLLPSTYYIDILVESNLEVTTIKNVVNFDIISESNLRKSQ